MAKKIQTRVKGIAKETAEQGGSVVAEALGAAAATAAGIVLTRVAEGLSAGGQSVKDKTPKAQKTAKRVTKKAIKRLAKKAAPRKKKSRKARRKK
jgi:hypothetical protein